MSIGSFLASAGRIGTGIEQAQTDSELRRLQREQAAGARAQMVRAEEERKQLQLARASGAGLPRVAGIFEPGQEQGAGPRPILAAVEPPAVPIATAAPAAAVDTTPASTAGLQTDTAPAPAAKVKVSQRTVGGKYVPMYNSKAPDRLHTSGVAGFGVISPNASQFERDQISSRNEARLDKLVRAMKVNTPLSGITKYFSPQDKKKAIENRENANTWYSSKQATTYFRANPEMISVASKDSIGFYNALMGYSKPAPEGGRWRGAAAPKAAKVDTAPAEVGTAGVRSTAPSGQTAAATTKARAYDAQGAQYDAVVQQAAAQYGVDAKILKRLIASESSFDPNIVNKTSGALGLAQIMPSHINKGLVSAAQARDPATAISFAAAHLAQNLRNEGGDYRKALLKYKGALSPKGTAAMSPVVRDITSGLQWDAQQVLGAVGPQLAQSRDPATNAALALRTNPSASGAPSGVSNGGVQLAGSATQEPVLKLSSLNTYLTKPDKIVPAVADTLSQRDLVKREAEIYASSGNEAAYQQSVAKLQQIDANLIRLQGAQAIIDTQTFLDPSRAEKLISYLSNGELQVQMRADGRFAYFGRNQKGQMVPIPGQDNVSRADFISTLRAATDESYRVRREAADIAAAAAQASFNQDIEKERFKGQIAGELQTQRLGVDAQRALLEAKTRLQIAERNGQNITSIGSGENEMFLQTNPDNPNDPWVFKPGGFETTGPGGTTIVTTDAIPFSQLAGTAQ